jgi:hypothetical protein
VQDQNNSGEMCLYLLNRHMINKKPKNMRKGYLMARCLKR